MTADVELLPLPEVLPFSAAGARKALQDWCRANVAHATAAKDAEIESLRADRDSFKQQAEHNLLLVERLAEALRELVALGHPRDPAIIAARTALRDHDQEGGNP